MHNTWLVLLPPFIVLLIALISKKLHIALSIGLGTAALIATDGSIWSSITLLSQRLWAQASDSDFLLMCGFLLMIGILITLLSATGAAQAFARTMTKRIRSKRAVEGASLITSCALFIDDYLSNLTVGYVIRPLSDQFSIPRSKLSFLIHSMSGPLVILIPISSWVAMITSQLDQSGIHTNGGNNLKIIADPFLTYLSIIPFIFYSFLLIGSVLFIVYRDISFGPMHTHEAIAQRTGNLFGGKPPLAAQKHESASQTTSSLIDLFIPLATLIATVMIGIPYAGGYSLFNSQVTLLEAFQNNNQTFFVLFCAAVFTLLTSLTFSYTRNTLQRSSLTTITLSGIDLMKGAIAMLFLASTLGTILRIDLLTGQYLASTLMQAVSISALPCMLFLTSTIIAIITGTSWGTIALMLPIAVPMIISFTQTTTPATLASLPILLPSLGAIFAGSVCGDHISPISETTIMASTSSGCYPFDHTVTQLPYALPAIIGSAIAFLISGYLANYSYMANISISLTAGFLVCFGLLSLLNKKP